MNSLLTIGGAAKWAVVLTLAVLMSWTGSLARIPVKGGPVGIVHLELAFTTRAADRFMQAWITARPTWQRDLNAAQAWDTWFICTYAPLFALLCWLAADQFAPNLPRIAAVGYALAGAQLLAGALDFIENAAMQRTIDAGHATAPWPLIGATASATKWALILVFALYAVIAGIHWLVGFVQKL